MRNDGAETKFLIIYNSVSEENKRDIMKANMISYIWGMSYSFRQ